MKLKIFILALLVSSCKQPSGNTGDNQPIKIISSDKNSLAADSNTQPNKSHQTSQVAADTLSQKAFWSSVVVPIVNKDDKLILTTIQSSVTGNWAYMIGLKKESDNTTTNTADFANNYNKLFTPNFIKILSTQTYRDINISKFEGTTYYSFEVSRNDIKGKLVGSVSFNYKKINNKYLLTDVFDAGGNFYDDKH